jgi:serine/threonine protein kinase HipA of HipAB toxin-antitoxin module
VRPSSLALHAPTELAPNRPSSRSKIITERFYRDACEAPHPGKGGRADLQYHPQVKYQAIVDFAHQRMKHHAPYSWNPFHMNTCKTFASDAVK